MLSCSITTGLSSLYAMCEPLKPLAGGLQRFVLFGEAEAREGRRCGRVGVEGRGWDSGHAELGGQEAAERAVVGEAQSADVGADEVRSLDLQCGQASTLQNLAQ